MIRNQTKQTTGDDTMAVGGVEDVGALAVRLSGGIYGIYGDIFQGNFSSSRCCLFFPWLFSIKRSPRCILIDRVESTGLNVLGLDWADCSVTNATGGCCVGDSKSVEEDCDGVCAAVVKGGQEGDDAGTREEGESDTHKSRLSFDFAR